MKGFELRDFLGCCLRSEQEMMDTESMIEEELLVKKTEQDEAPDLYTLVDDSSPSSTALQNASDAKSKRSTPLKVQLKSSCEEPQCHVQRCCPGRIQPLACTDEARSVRALRVVTLQ